MPKKPKSSPEDSEKTLQKSIIDSHQHLGYSATQWFEWMVDDCLAGFGKKLEKPWEEKQNTHLFELSRLYAECVIQSPFDDVLGNIYQELATNYGRKGLGQYFTPKPIAKMMALMQYDRSVFEALPAVRLGEPASGSGIMVLAFMETVWQDDPALVNKLTITCVDKDLLCVKMSVLQVMANNLLHTQNLGELVVYHGNSLGDPAELTKFFGATNQEFSARVNASMQGEAPVEPDVEILSQPIANNPPPVEIVNSPQKQPKSPNSDNPTQLDLFDFE